MLHDFDPYFWLTTIAAALIRVFNSEVINWRRSIITFATAVFCAWAFTHAMLDYLSLDHEVYRYPMAAIIAVTSENIMRMFLIFTRDFSGIYEIIKIWKGKK